MNKCEILGEFWLSYKHDEQYVDYINFNDIGLPVAYVISQGVVNMTPQAESFVNESFEMLLSTLGIDDDIGFESLEDLMLRAD